MFQESKGWISDNSADISTLVRGEEPINTFYKSRLCFSSTWREKAVRRNDLAIFEREIQTLK